MDTMGNKTIFNILTSEGDSDFDLKIENNEPEASFVIEEKPSNFNITVEGLESEVDLDAQEEKSELETTFLKGYSSFDVNNYNNAINKPKINGITLIGDKSGEELGFLVDKELSGSSKNPVENQAIFTALSNLMEILPKVESKTTEEWEQKEDYIPEKDTLIIYTDYIIKIKDGKEVFVPSFKVGDGIKTIKELSFINEGFEKIDDYQKLVNKPKIEGITLVGDKTFEELNLKTLSNIDIENILK